MIKRGGLPLRWRVAVLTAFSITLLAILAATSTFFSVRTGLKNDLQNALRRDAAGVAEVHNGRAQGEDLNLRSAPAGRVIIQIYSLDGNLLAASASEYEQAQSTLPQEIILDTLEGPRDWQGTVNAQPVQASMTLFNRGVVVVMSETSYIQSVVAQLFQRLSLITLALIPISALAGYIVARTAMRPITQLAQLTETLDSSNLKPIIYTGPQDEVGQLTNVFNDLLRRLSYSMDAQRSFLAESSHELRTPLTSLQGFLLRASRKANPSVQRDLDDAKRISQTMSRLVADLLQLSRGELIKEMVPHLIDPMEDILMPLAEEFTGVSLKGEVGETLVGDPERLRQLIRNLVSNAVRIAGEPSKVELSFFLEPQTAVLEVRDYGPGIPPDLHEKIFDKFYKGPGGGAGLGLAIAKQIAEAHSGSLSLDKNVTNGASFQLRLPIMEEPEDDMLNS